MNNYLGLRMKPPCHRHLLRLDTVVDIAKARVKNQPLSGLGSDIMPQVLVGDKDDFVLGD